MSYIDDLFSVPDNFDETVNYDDLFNDILKGINSYEHMVKKLDEFINVIDTSIKSLKDTEEYIVSNMDIDSPDNYVNQLVKGSRSKIIRKPYFTCNLGLTPPNNRIELERRQNCNYDFYDIKHELNTICSEKDREILVSSVGKFVFDQEITRIQCKKLFDEAEQNYIKQIKKMDFKELAGMLSKEMEEKISWYTISVRDLQGRISPENCEKMWKHLFNPKLTSYDDWTEDELESLPKLVKDYNKQWTVISEHLPRKRAPFLIFRKWMEINNKHQSDKEWSEQEDEQLKEVMLYLDNVGKERRQINWVEVSRYMSARSALDCDRRWSVVLTQCHSRPFSDSDDMTLLTLIKYIGTDNWAEISRNMDMRNTYQCELRYCQIIDEYQPWTYLEDRVLWLNLRSYLQQHCIQHASLNSADNFTKNIDLFKCLVPVIKNREAVVIRYRYGKLLRWFRIWNQFYLSLCITEGIERLGGDVPSEWCLLSQDMSRQCSVIAKLRKIILHNSLGQCLEKIFARSNNSTDVSPEQQAYNLLDNNEISRKLILSISSNPLSDPDLIEFIYFLRDIYNGCFVPRAFDNYARYGIIYNPSTDSSNDLRLMGHNIIKMQSGETLRASVMKQINKLLQETRPADNALHPTSKQLSCTDTQALHHLVESIPLFNSAFSFTCNALQKLHNFEMNCTPAEFANILPRFIRMMLQYCHERNYLQTKRSQSTSIAHVTTVAQPASSPVQSTSSNEHLLSKIADLLIFRDNIHHIYKTYSKTNLISKYIQPQLLKRLAAPTIVEDSREKTFNFMFKKLNASQSALAISTTNVLTDIDFLAPNRITLGVLRTLYLQTPHLVQQGHKHFIQFNKVKYNTSPYEHETNSNSSVPTNPLDSPHYKLLRNRLLSCLGVGSVISQMSIGMCYDIADRLHETQNNVECSQMVSEKFTKFNIQNILQNCKVKTSIKRNEQEALYYEDNNLESDIYYVKPLKRRQQKDSFERDSQKHVKRRRIEESSNISSPEPDDDDKSDHSKTDEDYDSETSDNNYETDDTQNKDSVEVRRHIVTRLKRSQKSLVRVELSNGSAIYLPRRLIRKFSSYSITAICGRKFK